MSKIICQDKAGKSHEIKATVGWNFLDLIRESGLEIVGLCGGCCACASCHIYVDPEWADKIPEITDEEASMLDGAFNVTANSRLACQIVYEPKLDGIKVYLV